MSFFFQGLELNSNAFEFEVCSIGYHLKKKVKIQLGILLL